MLKTLLRRQEPTRTVRSRAAKRSDNKKFANVTIVRQNFWHFAIWVLLASILFWGWAKLHNPTVLPIRTVNIAGDYHHTATKELQKIITPYVETNFFAVNLWELKSRLLQSPWVADVSIAKVWPQTINIKITEQKPDAVWNNDNLLNGKGEVFSPAKASFPKGLPNFYGPIGQQDVVLKAYRLMQAELLPLKLRIAAIELTERQAWRLQLNNGMYIILGHTDVMKHLQKMVAIYPKIIGSHGNLVNYLDLRYSNGVAVSWKVQN